MENNAGDDPRLKGYWYTNDDDGVGSAPEITAELEKDKIYYFVVGPHSTDTGEFSIILHFCVKLFYSVYYNLVIKVFFFK